MKMDRSKVLGGLGVQKTMVFTMKMNGFRTRGGKSVKHLSKMMGGVDFDAQKVAKVCNCHTIIKVLGGLGG